MTCIATFNQPRALGADLTFMDSWRTLAWAKCKEVCNFLRPPSPNFCCQGNKSCSVLSARELAQDTGALSFDEQPPEQRRQRGRIGGDGLHRSVLFTATCAPWNKGKPSARTSMRHSLSWFGQWRPSHPLQGTRVRLPTPRRTHDSQESPQRMLLGGGHRNRMDGHTDKLGWTRKELATSGEGEGCETLVRLTWYASPRETNTGEWSAATWPGNCLVISATPCLR